MRLGGGGTRSGAGIGGGPELQALSRQHAAVHRISRLLGRVGGQVVERGIDSLALAFKTRAQLLRTLEPVEHLALLGLPLGGALLVVVGMATAGAVVHARDEDGGGGHAGHQRFGDGDAHALQLPGPQPRYSGS